MPKPHGQAAAERRALRRGRYEALFPPATLAAAGAIASVAFLLQSSPYAKAGFFAFFLAASHLAGKRSSPAATILTASGIVAANLLVKVGRVVATIGPFQVTEQALLDGIDKALTFEGLIFASKAAILPSLRLPGRLGGILAAAFVYYDRIVEYKGKLRPASLIADADELMMRVWRSETPAPAPEAKVAAPAAGRLIAGLVILASGLLLVLALI